MQDRSPWWEIEIASFGPIAKCPPRERFRCGENDPKLSGNSSVKIGRFFDIAWAWCQPGRRPAEPATRFLQHARKVRLRFRETEMLHSQKVEKVTALPASGVVPQTSLRTLHHHPARIITGLAAGGPPADSMRIARLAPAIAEQDVGAGD